MPSHGRPSSLSSGEEDVNLTVETALEAFDFLNCEEEEEEEREQEGDVCKQPQPMRGTASPSTRYVRKGFAPFLFF